MPTRFWNLAIVLAISSLATLASANASASSESGSGYEACLTSKAFALELTGIEIDEVIGQAEQACTDARRGLANDTAGEVSQKVRLAVMQQRSNARNTRRRG